MIIKRNPIVLIRFFAAIEVAAFGLYLFATVLDEYKQRFYDFLPVSDFFSYSTFKFPFLSFPQSLRQPLFYLLLLVSGVIFSCWKREVLSWLPSDCVATVSAPDGTTRK